MRDPPRHLEGLYQKLLASKHRSEMRGHTETLRRLAFHCDHVTEFGVKTGQSTLAFLCAQPDYLVSVDLMLFPEIIDLMAYTGRTSFCFKREDSRRVKIHDTDMLFIDSTHLGEHLKQELDEHATKVRKYLVFHDTVSAGRKGFWYRDERYVHQYGKAVSVGDKGKKRRGNGLLPTIEAFLKSDNGWYMVDHYEHSKGLMVLGRTDNWVSNRKVQVC